MFKKNFQKVNVDVAIRMGTFIYANILALGVGIGGTFKLKFGFVG